MLSSTTERLLDAEADPDGPRERLITYGAAALSDAELLAVLLGTGTTGEPVEHMALRVLRAEGGLVGLARNGVGALRALPGLGPSKACRLVAAFEIGRRAARVPWPRSPKLLSSHDVARALGPRFARSSVEHFIAVALNARHRTVAEIELARGGRTACPVDPASVFRALLREDAAAVIFVHNHPSGETAPSPADVALTERLRQAGALLGIEVLDHVILGAEGHFSFLDSGLLDAARPEEQPEPE